MYATCIFCHASLGANEAIEHFPVGRRLAFDAAKGRLWVVCARCARWNLTPLEERWEAIEECERAFRGTTLRASTGNVGLARLRDGTELVRIGAPLRPELAAWRYGRRFAQRHRRALATAGVAGAVLFSGAAALVATGVAGVGSLYLAYLVGGRALIGARNRRVLARTYTPHGQPLQDITLGDLARSALVPHPGADGWALRLEHASGELLLDGPPAVRMLGRVIAGANAAGGSAEEVQGAVERLASFGSAREYFAFLAKVGRAHGGRGARHSVYSGWNAPPVPFLSSFAGMTIEERLAVEMAAHEEVERRALEGELRELEIAWREAEEIAAIADDLLLPPSLDRLLRARRREPPPQGARS